MATYPSINPWFPVSVSAPPPQSFFPTLFFLVQSTSTKAEMEVTNGEVLIPEALKRGFLQPVLEWVASEQEAESAENVGEKIFHNSET